MPGRKIIVGPDGNVEKALRKFKKKIAESGLLQEVRDRQEFVKPTIERKIKKSQAKRRWKKYLREQQLPPKLY
jgi:small subunit ribosomal protein S21